MDLISVLKHVHRLLHVYMFCIKSCCFQGKEPFSSAVPHVVTYFIEEELTIADY